MKNTKRLKFNAVMLQLEMVEYASADKILGGYVPPADFRDDETITGGPLDEVVINGNYYGGSDFTTGPFFGGGSTEQGTTGGGGGGGGSSTTNNISASELLNQAGYWSYVNGEYVWTVNGGELPEVTVNVGYTASDAIGVMLSSMGLAADHAAIAAAAAKIEAVKGFNLTSTAFGILGVGQNVMEMVAEGEWNWQDGGQAALGAALLIPGLNGAIVIGGGAVLFGWELYELVQGN